MVDYKYAIISGNTIRLCNDYENIWCSREELMESPKTKIKNGILTISGDMVQYDFNMLGKHPKVEDIEDHYIETYKTWFGLGKEKKRVKSHWVRLKKRKHMRLTFSNFELIEEK